MKMSISIFHTKFRLTQPRNRSPRFSGNDRKTNARGARVILVLDGAYTDRLDSGWSTYLNIWPSGLTNNRWTKVGPFLYNRTTAFVIFTTMNVNTNNLCPRAYGARISYWEFHLSEWWEVLNLSRRQFSSMSRLGGTWQVWGLRNSVQLLLSQLSEQVVALLGYLHDRARPLKAFR